MKILSKISVIMIILIFSLTFGQVAKEDSVMSKDSELKTESVRNVINRPRNEQKEIKGLELYDRNKISFSLYFNGKARFIIDGKTIEIREGDSLAIGMITEEAIIDSSIASDNLKIGSEYKGKVINVNERSVYVETFIDGILVKFKMNSDAEFFYKTRKVDMNNIEILKVQDIEDVLRETAKPIIYLYPEKETEVNVKLDYKGAFTATYPKYPKYGWNVTAKPDGKLIDKKGKEYYSLFWEGVTDQKFTINEGKVVKREDTADFLEKSLKILGLNYKEANEFIIYWLPELEKNPYNLIHFSTSEYEALAKLTVTPKPETMIRVFMVFQALNKPVEVKEQVLVSKSRKGFTVVEWGGSEIKEGNIIVK